LGRSQDIEEDGGSETSLSSREGQDSRGSTRAHQQEEGDVFQGSLAEFQHGDISDREGDREASAIHVRTGRFKRDADRRPGLSGGTDSGSRHETTVYKIEIILDKRVRPGNLEYLVRWRGYSGDFDSWIPDMEREICTAMIRNTFT